MSCRGKEGNTMANTIVADALGLTVESINKAEDALSQDLTKSRGREISGKMAPIALTFNLNNSATVTPV